MVPNESLPSSLDMVSGPLLQSHDPVGTRAVVQCAFSLMRTTNRLLCISATLLPIAKYEQSALQMPFLYSFLLLIQLAVAAV